VVEETKKLTEKQEAFLEALCGEAKGNIRVAMNLAGYSENTKISEVVNALKNDIVERSSLLLAMNAPKATFSMIDVLDDPGQMGARNAVSAATQILDRTGLVKKEQIQVTTDTGGLFILPPKQAEDDSENNNSGEMGE
jgi:hypothetical protein